MNSSAANTSSIPQILFFGASQVYGWQGNYSSTPFPFGADVQTILNNTIEATISGLPGDCLANPGCRVWPAPGQRQPISGFFPRLTSVLLSTNTYYEMIVILGGANGNLFFLIPDIKQACLSSNFSYLNNLDAALRQLTALSLSSARTLYLLSTFQSPEFTSGSCLVAFDLYKAQFSKTAADIIERNPGRVYYQDSTVFLPDYKSQGLYVDSIMHLNQAGNQELAVGLSKNIIPILSKNTSGGTHAVGSSPSQSSSLQLSIGWNLLAACLVLLL